MSMNVCTDPDTSTRQPRATHRPPGNGSSVTWWVQYMTRALHSTDSCTVTERSLRMEIESLLTAESCVIAPEDSRLAPIIPINGQQTLQHTQLPLPTGTTICTAPRYRNAISESTPDQSNTYLPHTSREQFHFKTNVFDTVCLLSPKCGYFQRAPPFLDATRIVKEGGTLVSVTGLQPTHPADHDAKWWIPQSDDVGEPDIRLLRTDEYKTPIVMTTFTVTSSQDRYSDADCVTTPGDTTQVTRDRSGISGQQSRFNTHTGKRDSHMQQPTHTTHTAHKTTHEQNNNWEWSDELTQFVTDRISGLSLKVCTGLKPICDLNLDISNLRDISSTAETAYTVSPIENSHESDDRLEQIYETFTDDTTQDSVYARVTTEHDADCDPELYDGYACHGDAFDLPFDDNTFDTVVSDPPWLDMPALDRKALFNELIRVTATTGAVLYNAPWVPTHENTRRYDLRARQQQDFWGGPSLICCYRRTAATTDELFEAHDYSSLNRYPETDSFWDEDFHPNAISKQHGTDPNMVSPSHTEYRCPKCRCTELNHVRQPEFQSKEGNSELYECFDCRFRMTVDEATHN